MVPNKEDNYPAIYLFLNKNNGRIYVGAAKNLYKRYKGYRDFSNSSKKAGRGMEHALRKWGLDEFDFQVLERVENTDFLKEREQYWMDTLKPFKNKGYNWATRSNYGNASAHPKSWAGRSEHSRKTYYNKLAALFTEYASKPVYQIDKATLKIIKEYPSAAAASRDHNLPRYAIKMLCRANTKARSHDGGYFWCYKEVFDINGFKPLSQQVKCRHVKQLDEDQNVIKIWNSFTEAAKILGLKALGIRRVCDGKRKHCGGWIWEYTESITMRKKALSRKQHESSENKHERLERQSILASAMAESKPIIQSDKNGNFVKIWDGAAFAARQLGLKKYAISRCCNGGRPTAFGYHWSFVTDPMILAQIQQRRVDELDKIRVEVKKAA